MRQLSDSDERIKFLVASPAGVLRRLSLVLGFTLLAGGLQGQEQTASAVSREVKEIFERSARAVVKIRGIDEHGKLAGTGFFVDPTGTIYTAYSVGADADDFTVEMDGKEIPARPIMADRRSGIALLKVEMPTPALPLGRSGDLVVA